MYFFARLSLVQIHVDPFLKDVTIPSFANRAWTAPCSLQSRTPSRLRVVTSQRWRESVEQVRSF